jgi:hypothetical protein
MIERSKKSDTNVDKNPNRDIQQSIKNTEDLLSKFMQVDPQKVDERLRKKGVKKEKG